MFLPILMLYWGFTNSPNFQTNCVNDFSPLIAALATLLTVQAPVLVGLAVNQFRLRNELARNTHMTRNIQEVTNRESIPNNTADTSQPGREYMARLDKNRDNTL